MSTLHFKLDGRWRSNPPLSTYLALISRDFFFYLFSFPVARPSMKSMKQ